MLLIGLFIWVGCVVCLKVVALLAAGAMHLHITYHYVPMGWQALIVVWLVLCWSCCVHTPPVLQILPNISQLRELMKHVFFEVVEEYRV